MRKTTWPAIIAALAVPALMAAPAAAGEWVQVTNHEGCEVWNDAPQEEETATWIGSCTGGMAAGEGVLVWRYTVEGEEQRASYHGHYVAGREHGQGTFFWANGDVYEGNWRDGQLHGNGKFSFADGQFCEGYWQNGSLRSGGGHDGSRARPCRIDGSGLHWLD